jgi:hypothetical protein
MTQTRYQPKPEGYTEYYVKHFYNKDGLVRSYAMPGRWGSINGAELCFRNTCEGLITGLYDAGEESVALIRDRWEPTFHPEHGWGVTLVESKTIKENLFGAPEEKEAK